MKMGMFLLVNVLLVTFATAQYKPAEDGSSIEFKVKHFGINTSGSFSGLNGTINFDRNSPATSQFDVTVDANSIRTGIDLRDSHLRGDSYFDIEKYPRLHFVSTKITETGKSEALFITGQLTIKNHTKDISFPFTATPSDTGYLFKGSFAISREDFEVGGSGVISDNVEVLLIIAATK